MYDTQLIQLFRPIILSGLAAQGLSSIPVIAAYQSTLQGVDNGPVIYFYKVSDHRYGFMKREDSWDPIASQMKHTETQVYETIFSIQALSIQDPTQTSQYTASDLANIVSLILQSSSCIQTLRASDVGIYKITDIRNPYFVDDKDIFEAAASFDFTLTHKQINVILSPVITDIHPGIYPI